MSTTGSSSRALTIALAAMAFAIAFHALHALFELGGSSLDGFTTDGVYTAIEVVAVGVCAARVLRRREDRAAWLENLATAPYPSIADVFYFAMYPAIYIGLVLIMRSQFSHAGVTVLLDG